MTVAGTAPKKATANSVRFSSSCACASGLSASVLIVPPSAAARSAGRATAAASAIANTGETSPSL